MMKNLLALAFFLVIGYMTPLYAENEDEDKEGKTKFEAGSGIGKAAGDIAEGDIDVNNFGFKVGIGTTYSGWIPDDDKILSFETEGLETYEFLGQLRYKDYPIVSIRHERPFSSTPSQQQILQQETQENSSSFLEKYASYLDLRPLINVLQIENSFSTFLLSARLRYEKTAFFWQSGKQERFSIYFGRRTN
ncbi:MAG: hypothetical protein DRR08_03530 [Candidatus Parabeggiatoa sp. nov. 2]|nr:MAG: hypothetical protein B6247_14105 [Beggiatoa sp. 4572_84]RKZ63414.1 MAG: hypothetical protein DRR08_03530 [Gammaproteobacteria bacterium]